jgi:hypothetical protein
MAIEINGMKMPGSENAPLVHGVQMSEPPKPVLGVSLQGLKGVTLTPEQYQRAAQAAGHLVNQQATATAPAPVSFNNPGTVPVPAGTPATSGYIAPVVPEIKIPVTITPPAQEAVKSTAVKETIGPETGTGSLVEAKVMIPGTVKYSTIELTVRSDKGLTAQDSANQVAVLTQQGLTTHLGILQSLNLRQQ